MMPHIDASKDVGTARKLCDLTGGKPKKKKQNIVAHLKQNLHHDVLS